MHCHHAVKTLLLWRHLWHLSLLQNLPVRRWCINHFFPLLLFNPFHPGLVTHCALALAINVRMRKSILSDLVGHYIVVWAEVRKTVSQQQSENTLISDFTVNILTLCWPALCRLQMLPLSTLTLCVSLAGCGRMVWAFSHIRLADFLLKAAMCIISGLLGHQHYHGY